jgi:hypothetical protein
MSKHGEHDHAIGAHPTGGGDTDGALGPASDLDDAVSVIDKVLKVQR